MLRKFMLVCALALGVFGASTAQAIPHLQIYIDGATYDAVSETWIVESDAFQLWVISDGTVADVKLAAAVYTAEAGTIGLAGTTTGGTGGFTDPSVAAAPVYNGLSADGAQPVRGDGSLLAAHGIYGAGVSFHEWSLGDMLMSDSPIADFITSFPTPTATMGQINAYNVTLTGYSRVHFDAYDHTVDASSHGDYYFAPFSHDGEGGGTGGSGGSGGTGGSGGGGGSVPEPGTMFLLGGGLLVLAANRKK